ncbi:MAG: hypothetical protein ABI791_05660 [Acidobacteriota bacterium]
MKYLQYPNLRQHEAEQALIHAALKAQSQADRSGSTVQERAAYVVSDNKAAFILGAIFLVIGIGIFAITMAVRPKKIETTATPVSSSVPNADAAAAAARRNFAAQTTAAFKEAKRDVIFEASAGRDDTMFVHGTMVSEKLVAELKSPENIEKFRKLGFKTVLISAGKREWRFTP